MVRRHLNDLKASHPISPVILSAACFGAPQTINRLRGEQREESDFATMSSR